jgi:Txe/YoeB family toxin of Txe-Axe toxin-antitoxin module
MSKKVTTETELRQKMKLWGEQEKQESEQISSLIQSMRQEREEIKQESEQRQQELSSAVSRMERALSRLKATGCLLFN